MDSFYAYRNYLIGLKAGIVSLIVPKKGLKIEKLKGLISYPLSVFYSRNVSKKRKKVQKAGEKLLDGLRDFRRLRSTIER